MSGKYFGKYRGIVTAVDNSKGMWKIRASVPKLLNGYTTGWALPCLAFAFGGARAFFKVSVGDMVWIEFEQGDIDKPIWTGGWFTEGKSLNSSGIEMNGTLLEWTEEGIKVHGDLVVDGSLTVDSIVSTGNITAIGTVESMTDVLAGEVSLISHTHESTDESEV